MDPPGRIPQKSVNGGHESRPGSSEPATSSVVNALGLQAGSVEGKSKSETARTLTAIGKPAPRVLFDPISNRHSLRLVRRRFIPT